MSSQVKNQLNELIQNNNVIDTKVKSELSQISALLEIKQDSTAIFKVTKIIENLLKEYYKDSTDLKELATKNNRKTPVLADYIELSKVQKLISNEDYHLLSVLKSIRNEEAHQLEVKKEFTRLVASIITGFNLIIILSSRLNKKTIL